MKIIPLAHSTESTTQDQTSGSSSFPAASGGVEAVLRLCIFGVHFAHCGLQMLLLELSHMLLLIC